jgi:uncharacterized phiE125 gp8 family phage protein
MLSLDPLGLDGAMLDEARAFLRIDPVEEDPSLAAAIRAAVVHAEHFTRTVLIRRPARETMCASSGWHRLYVAPVVAVTGVTGLSLEGSRAVLPPDAWQTKLGSLGEAYVRLLRPGPASQAEIAVIAGLSECWADLPESLRLGILRLAAHFHSHRDAPTDAGPPAAARAMLLPWRRMSVD